MPAKCDGSVTNVLAAEMHSRASALLQAPLIVLTLRMGTIKTAFAAVVTSGSSHTVKQIGSDKKPAIKGGFLVRPNEI